MVLSSNGLLLVGSIAMALSEVFFNGFCKKCKIALLTIIPMLHGTLT